MNLTDLIGPIESANPEPSRTCKVVLWGQAHLLARAVGSFLEKTAWEVVQIPNTGYVETLIEGIRQNHPDVVILCHEKANEDSVLALRLIDKDLCPRVVTISMDSNITHVYNKQNVLLHGASDLLSIIEPDIAPNFTSEKEVQTKHQSLQNTDQHS